ncbi:hypothetical protein ACVWZW_000755 [Bradyrhizobium sp. F1.13.4]
MMCDPMIHYPLDPWAPGVKASDCPTIPHGKGPLFTRGGIVKPDPEPDNVIELNAAETITITELTPYDDRFIGKRLLRDGRVLQYPQVKFWKQSVTTIPASMPALYSFLNQARLRNVCLIRGAPANIERKKTRRQLANETRGDHGFTDEPTRLHFFDIDGAAGTWRDDPAAAVHRLVIDMGEPWASASYVWFFSGGHGLAMEIVDIVDENNEARKVKVWNGQLDDSKIRVRLAFILDRAITWREAAMLTDIVAATSGLPLDGSIVRTVQPNYILRPRWDGHPGDDVLGDIETIGIHGGAVEVTEVVFTEAETSETKTITPTVTVPADLPHKARWAAAQGHGAAVADHPDALTAVLGIGSDGRVRQHLMAAVVHLLDANPPPEQTSAIDHGLRIADDLKALVEQHRESILAQLDAHDRSWADVDTYLVGMADVARWIIERPGAFKRRTVKLEQEVAAEPTPEPTTEGQVDDEAQEIFGRVQRRFEAFANETDKDSVTLLVAPTGSRKSTLINATAVRLAAELGEDESIVILVARHKLGDELVEAMHEEHPDRDFTVAIWRGRHRVDTGFIGPQKPGQEKLMCWRSKEAAALEDTLVKVENHLCKHGRGAGAIVCPFASVCGSQRQKRVRAQIWVAAHEILAHEPPKAFGTVVKVFIDESPTDALLFGVDQLADKDKYILDIDQLLEKPNWFRWLSLQADLLMRAREALYLIVTDAMDMPRNRHHGAPLTAKHVFNFTDEYLNAPKSLTADDTDVAEFNTKQLVRLEWIDKEDPAIIPTMGPMAIEAALTTAAENRQVKKLVTLWQLIGQLSCLKRTDGRVQIHYGASAGQRLIRMCGLREVAEGWRCPVLICDATGDPWMLYQIWPKIECDDGGFRQLPKPASVAISQIVDRSVSKWAVAVEGPPGTKDRTRRENAARRLYAAALTTALAYGGAKVGLITYKSTEAWIRANCFVPDWLRLHHFGAVEGTNELQGVRALIVAGRPLANPEAVSRIAEALFGEHVTERDYVTVAKGGKINRRPQRCRNHQRPGRRLEAPQRERRARPLAGHREQSDPSRGQGSCRAPRSRRSARHPSLARCAAAGAGRGHASAVEGRRTGPR